MFIVYIFCPFLTQTTTTTKTTGKGEQNKNINESLKRDMAYRAREKEKENENWQSRDTQKTLIKFFQLQNSQTETKGIKFDERLNSRENQFK